MKPRKFSPETWNVCYCEAYREFDNGQILGPSSFTGFFWRKYADIFLITNWHNLTGINPQTKKPLGSFTPNTLRIRYWACKGSATPGQLTFVRRDVKSPLYTPDDVPIWKEHPKKSNVDIVAIKLEIEDVDGAEIKAITDNDYEPIWQPVAGDDCFVVGYPEGLNGPSDTAIWKRASIASEPDLDFDGHPVFLVDTIGNSGLSGSPVVARGSGILQKGESFGDASQIGTWSKFVGIYAGRMGTQGVQSQLGRIWKEHLIEEICANQKVSANPHTT